MFTGLIEELGKVASLNLRGDSGRLRLAAETILDDCRLGDSIAVNGVCLTVVEIAFPEISFDVSAETLRRSNLGRLRPGDRVNLERALPANGRFGGHLVAGHTDATGTLKSRNREGNAVIFTFSAPPEIARYLIEKGSIAIDGISLTITGIRENDFSVAVIPHSLARTTLNEKEIGATVNLEVDLVAKYIEKLLQPRTTGDVSGARKIDLGLLQKHGFA